MSDPFTKADWIWLNKTIYPEYQKSAYTFFCDKQPYCVAKFSKRVSCKEATKSIAYVSADCKYILKLNGEVVARGPAVVGGDYGNTQPLGYRFYDCPTVLYRKGENIIEALVILQPAMESDYSDGLGGFIFQSEVRYSDGTRDWFVSDESWIAVKDDACIKTFYTDFTKISARNAFAQKVEHPWNLIEKNIPELGSETIFPINGTEFSAKKGESAFVDFGKVYCGYLELTGYSEEESEVTLEFFERENFPITFRDSGKEYLKMPKGEFAFSHLHLRSARYVKVTVNGGAVKFQAKWQYVTYPVKNRGRFRCSDERLNRIYDVCVRTTRNCMNTYHMDSPVHQEAIGCTGDYLIQSLIGYYAFGDTKLTRLDLWRDSRYFELKGGHRLHASYGMLWVEWLLDYVKFSGDESILRETENALKILMARYEGYLDENGIVVHSHNFWFVDWSLPSGIGIADAKIVWQAALTAFTYRGFVCAERLMQKLDQKETAEHYAAVAQKIKSGFCKTFWDQGKGLYFGGLENDGTVGRKYFGVHENILAVLYGLTDRDPTAIMEKVINDSSLTPAQPYFMHFLFLALDKVGLFEKYALPQLLKWEALLSECDSSLKESWGGLEGCDYSHAWSATPAYILPSLILGVKPASDGFGEIYFEPNLCGLDWAEGVIPTPHGDYFVRVDRNGKNIEKTERKD